MADQQYNTTLFDAHYKDFQLAFGGVLVLVCVFLYDNLAESSFFGTQVHLLKVHTLEVH